VPPAVISRVVASQLPTIFDPAGVQDERPSIAAARMISDTIFFMFRMILFIIFF
jgi:hypothetical protein